MYWKDLDEKNQAGHVWWDYVVTIEEEDEKGCYPTVLIAYTLHQEFVSKVNITEVMTGIAPNGKRVYGENLDLISDIEHVQWISDFVCEVLNGIDYAVYSELAWQLDFRQGYPNGDAIKGLQERVAALEADNMRLRNS